MEQVQFVFKLRSNIDLEGDVDLAAQELTALLGSPSTGYDEDDDILSLIPELREFTGKLAIGAHTREKGKRFFLGNGDLWHLPMLIKRVSFLQAIYCVTNTTGDNLDFIGELRERVGDVITSREQNGKLLIHAVPHYALIELLDVVAAKSKDVMSIRDNLDSALLVLTGNSEDRTALKLTNEALARKATSSHLSHDIHYYKAKFFPRLARCMLNIGTLSVGSDNPRIIDNFVGSGTTLLEASLLGMPSIGLDIDPLSVLIARTKLEVANMDSELLWKEATRAASLLSASRNGSQPSLFDSSTKDRNGAITFPAWFMKNRRMSVDIAQRLDQEIGQVHAIISQAPEQVRDLFRVLLSDAISRHIRMRFMGTGVGRFALSFSKTPIKRLFVASAYRCAKVAALFEWLKERIGLRLAPAEARVADTRSIPFEDGYFDVLVTSPPYLPASSGRESYAKGRAVSLLALGMTSVNDLDNLVDDSVGSMDEAGVNVEELTPPVRDMYEWLINDELRRIKAVPAARYFVDMRQVFKETARVLKPGGVAIIVSGKQSTFYASQTREVLYTVESAQMLANEARIAGLDVQDLHDVQLQKANMNARPRSLDDYYETLITLRKPNQT